MIAMSFNTSTNIGNNTPGSLNNGMVNSNVLMGIGQSSQSGLSNNNFATGIWQSWQNTPQTRVQSGFVQGNGGLSFNNSGNFFECPLCKGPTWAKGRVCEHCKTNISRWRHMPLISLGLNFSDVCMLKTQLSELERQEKKLRLQQQSGLPFSGSANWVVVKGFMR